MRHRVRERAGLRLDGLGEAGEGVGVQGVGVQGVRLGQAAGRPGEVADLAGVDHRHGQAGRPQGGGEGPLPPAGGLAHHQRRRQLAEVAHEQRAARRVVGLAPAPAPGPNRDVERAFGHIDPHVWCSGHPSPLVLKSPTRP